MSKPTSRRQPFSLPLPQAMLDDLAELNAATNTEAAAAGHPAASLAFTARQALEIGLAELRRRRAPAPSKRAK